MTKAIYPGTFDPITNGHFDLIVRAARLFDEVIVAVADNPAKKTMFTLSERCDLIREVFDAYFLNGLNIERNVTVVGYTGLTTDLAKMYKSQAMIRGLRAVTDFEYEFQLTHINRHLDPDLETVFLTAKPEHTFISSSMVRELAKFGGDVSSFVHPVISKALKLKLAK